MTRLFLSLIAMLIALGCQSDREQHPQRGLRSQKQPHAMVVEKLNEDGLRRMISQRDGKILLLNVWATWCLPCREEFPELVKLSNDFQQKDVELVGLSVDYPDEVDTKIIPFLKSVQANFKVLVQDFNDPTNMIQLLDAKWSGALPATFIFDALGNRQAVLVGSHGYEDFKRELEKLLINQ